MAADHTAADCPYGMLINKILSDVEESRREARAADERTQTKLTELTVEISKVQQSGITGRAMWAGIVVGAGLLGGSGAILIQKLMAVAPAVVPSVTKAIVP